MKILVDSGATKANWVAVSEGKTLHQLQTQGISPYFLTDEGIVDVLREVRRSIPEPVSELYFYSTGCKAEDQRRRMNQLLRLMFQEATQVQVETDMLAAARAMSQREAGIVCILGTGSNACRYDGSQIVETAGGLGFILGDEGSGAGIGKELIRSFLNREMPEKLREDLNNHYHLTRDNILQSVYQLPYPNRFLSTFAPFAFEHREEPSIRELLDRQFGLFFQRSVRLLEGSQHLPIHFVGSVAAFFKEEIARNAAPFGLQLANFQQDPMAGLIQYHN
ncbi:BadF/BadG/BcrA/BcrD ATPase family protein [Haliscomenobacter sp.]|uniref:BadF/BadG/BcrA/BcrD ATPase family protein n=1 Tax=Haliscomenobacter sp. TaxID=2717303 RepID=UPI003BAABFB1